MARYTTQSFVKAAQEILGTDHYDYSEVVYKGNTKPVRLVCTLHGPFYLRPNEILSMGRGCPVCDREARDLRRALRKR